MDKYNSAHWAHTEWAHMTSPATSMCKHHITNHKKTDMAAGFILQHPMRKLMHMLMWKNIQKHDSDHYASMTNVMEAGFLLQFLMYCSRKQIHRLGPGIFEAWLILMHICHVLIEATASIIYWGGCIQFKCVPKLTQAVDLEEFFRTFTSTYMQYMSSACPRGQPQGLALDLQSIVKGMEQSRQFPGVGYFVRKSPLVRFLSAENIPVRSPWLTAPTNHIPTRSICSLLPLQLNK